MSDRVGQQLGNYRLVQLLGSGGFADVYLAKQIYLDSPAAIKLLRTNLAQEDMEGFRAEARTLAHLIHPHIVRLLDFGLEGATPFLVMDYAPNGTLRQRHQRGERLAPATVVEYVDQVASALQYAHDQKVIHRDIKPENMLLGRDQEILLTDFGIAVVAQSTRLQLTQETVGTISYMAPEQIQAHPRPASDQYSLGIVVYEWLSGSRPFSGTFTEVAAKHLMAPPPPLRGQAPTISPAIEEVIFTALAKDPKHRFGSVQAFANALKQASQARQGIFPVPGLRPGANIQPTNIPVAIMPTVFDVQPREAGTVLNTPANPLMAQPREPATVLNTPARPQGIVLSPGGEDAIPTMVTRPDSPTELISSPPMQSQPKPAQQGISRRTVIVAGAAAAGVLAVGGVTWFLLQHSTSTSAGQTTGGTTITPTAPSTPTSAPTRPVASMLAQDTFHRPNQTFWGIASDGHKWGGEANVLAGFSIAGGMGHIHRFVSGHSFYTAILGKVITDADLVVSASLSRFNPSHLGVALRFRDDINYYKVLVDQGQLSILKRVNNIATTLQKIPFAAQANTLYTIRFRAVGTTLQAKVWQTGGTEPAGWMVTATDNTFQSGWGGLRPQLDQNDTLQISLFNMTMPANS